MRGKVAQLSILLSTLCVLLLGGCNAQGETGHEDGPPFPKTQRLSEQETRRLHRIRDTVAELRGLEVDSSVKEGMIDRQKLRAYFESVTGEDEAEEKREHEAWNIAYRMLRMIGPDDDLAEISTDSYSTQVVGLYLPDERRLVLVGEEITGSIWEESTIAHEYTHSLQHKAFDIENLERNHEENPDAEYGTTMNCVIEGDATFTEYKYLEEVYGEDWFLHAFEDDDQPSLAEETWDEQEAASIPEAMQRYFFFPYEECYDFVQQIWDEDGWKGVNRLFQEPPATTEQVLHVDKYHNGERPIEVPAPDLTANLRDAWSEMDSGVFGEFDVYNYLLSAGLSDRVAARAAAGWGGGRIRVYTRGAGENQDVLLHIILAWDTGDDYEQFRLAFTTGISKLDYDQISSSGRALKWQSPGEYGIAVWEDVELQARIVFSTDPEAMDRVERDGLEPTQ